MNSPVKNEGIHLKANNSKRVGMSHDSKVNISLVKEHECLDFKIVGERERLHFH